MTKEKNLREYFDLFEFLNRDVEKKDLDKEDEKDKERRRPDRTWANWLPVFLIYAGVAVKAQPRRVQSLF